MKKLKNLTGADWIAIVFFTCLFIFLYRAMYYTFFLPFTDRSKNTVEVIEKPINDFETSINTRIDRLETKIDKIESILNENRIEINDILREQESKVNEENTDEEDSFDKKWKSATDEERHLQIYGHNPPKL